ncbi:MAG TPA: ATP-binding protein [Vicinamibacterales bacterium]|jgi:signal transduction histidine kinase/CheY-like chemotaxis protein
MGPYAFSQAFVSGFFAFAAVSSFVLWLRTRHDWTALLLTAVCAIGSVQSVAILTIATTESAAQAQNAQEVRVVCGLMSFASLAWLYAAMAHVRARWYLWFVTATAVVVASFIVLDLDARLLGEQVIGVKRITLPWGEPYSLLEHTPGRPLVSLVYAVMASTVVFNIGCAIRLMARDRLSGALLMVATLVSMVALISGALVDISEAPIPYIGTFGIAAFILVIGLQLAVSRRHDEELLAAQRTQRALEHRLAQAQKMEALGQLASGVAHDFNNILTVIGGHADMLLPGASDETRSDIEQIRQAATRAASMTGQLLAFSRQSVLEPKDVDINSVVQSTETMLRRTIGEHIELVVRLEPKLWHVRADANQLGRVLLNVAINARDAMPHGGRLTIETSNVDNGSRPPVAESEPGRYVVMSVADNGMGMSSATKAHLFEPFFTTKDLGRGTGLGLAVVDGIVTQTGGYIDVDSHVGHGTTFKIFLPASDRAAPDDAGRSETEPAGAGSETILLLEDDPDVLGMTRAGLERYGYSVLVAGNGDEAVRVAQEHAGHIDLVVADVLTPGLTGPQTVDRLRAANPSLRVLFISGYDRSDAIHREVASGQSTFLQKPFTSAELAAKVRSMLDG